MDDYFDKSNRHEVGLHRVATGLINDYTTPNLQAVYKKARLMLLDAEEIKSVSQLTILTNKIAREILPETTATWAEVTAALQIVAVNEVLFNAKLFKDIEDVKLKVPADKKILKYINNSLLTLEGGARSNSGVWAEYVKQNSASVGNVYNNQIKSGYAAGESVNQITKRLRTVTNGILKNEAEALVRTGMSHYAVNARESMMRDNEDVVTGRYFNSVFDNKRTLICTSYAARQDSMSKPWGVNDASAPNLPLHFNERSNWLFLVRDQKRPEGTRAAVGGKEGEEAKETFERRENSLNKRRDNPNITGKTSSKPTYRGRKDSDTFNAGQIAGDTKAAAWLRSQPSWFQDSNLGKARGDLFRSGRLKLEKLTDFTGKPLTIKELIDSGV